MKQLNTFVFYMLGKMLDSCFLTIRQPIKSNIVMFQGAHQVLGMLLDGGQIRLDVSSGPARALREVLATILQFYNATPDDVVPDVAIAAFNAAMANLDTALGLELGRAPTFYVTPKGVFDTRVMIAQASLVYTDRVAKRLPQEAIRDTDEAGKCLAFSLGTAAGFHIARATEAVIKRYMEVFGCPMPKESQRNWGAYINALNDKGANRKVTQHLAQIKDLHRNPLIHPEVTLGLAEAVTLWALCTSAIHGMVADMEGKSAEPDPSLMAILPANGGGD